MMANPDQLYNQSRDALIQYEDSEFNYLLGNVPNFYISQTDQTIWGSLLRNVATELARLEYAHTYDIIGKNPANLTPPDAKRQWGDVLFISRNSPYPGQYDQDYLSLVVNLVKAFQTGCRVVTLENIIQAYTGQSIVVQELYKLIGNGVYDATDRNTLQISVQVAGSDSGSLINFAAGEATISGTISTLQTITNDLYTAIDLAKPAHVGLNLSAIFGQDEHIGDYVYGRYGIDDSLTIIASMVEDLPFPLPLYQAPSFDSDSPDTGLASTDTDSNEYNSFVQASSGAPPLQETYTLAEFNTYSTYAKGNIVPVGNQPPFPGEIGPTLVVWEVSDDNLDIMDMD
jgi:hypothetical protein